LRGIFAFAYDTLGRRTKLTYPNGVTTTYSYDSIGRLTNLLTQYAELKDQGKKRPPTLKLHTLDSFTYTHDKAGNRLTKTDTHTETDTDTKYTYDAIYRLLQSTPVKIGHNGKEREFEHKSEIFTYDAVGNRLTGPKDKLSYTYNTANQLTELTKVPLNKRGKGVLEDEQENKVEYTYDKNGNLIKKVEFDDDRQIKKTTLYSYDFESRLTKVEIQKKDKVKIITFTYNPFGRRLSKAVHREEIEDDEDNDRDDDDKVTPRATYYIYDNEDIIMEYNHKGKVTERYVYGLGIDEPLAVEKRIHTHSYHHSHIYYYHFDGLGSVTSLTDSKGKVAQRYEYDSFGKLKRHGQKVKQPYTYTAREWDRETKLYYYRARYYDPQIGRFISFDPILHPTMGPPKNKVCSQTISYPTLELSKETPQKLNPYSYTINNPIIYTDPYGEGVLDCVKCILKSWKIGKTTEECDKEAEKCKTIEDTIDFLNKYEANYLAEAKWKCVINRVGPDEYAEWFSSCFNCGTLSLTAPRPRR
jgi:RHS repeat-associated protein